MIGSLSAFVLWIARAWRMTTLIDIIRLFDVSSVLLPLTVICFLQIGRSYSSSKKLSFLNSLACWYFFFSSTDLKAQVSYFYHLLSVVRLSVHLCVCKHFLLSVHLCVNFYIFDFSEPQDQFVPDLAQIILWGRGFKFIQMKGNTLLQEEIKVKE
jgi:hypothetical protein